MDKYRVKVCDRINDIWIIQKRFLLVFWNFEDAGSYSEAHRMCDNLNKGKANG